MQVGRKDIGIIKAMLADALSRILIEDARADLSLPEYGER
jgi:hypothetical protein